MILCLALVRIVITNVLNLEIENFSSGESQEVCVKSDCSFSIGADVKIMDDNPELKHERRIGVKLTTVVYSKKG